MCRLAAASGLLWVWLVVACGTAGVSVPATLTDVPILDEDYGQRTWQARRLHEAGQDPQALDLLREVLAAAPEHVDAQRVRQDILRRRGRLGRLQWEAEERLRTAPDSAMAHYLAGRIERSEAEKKEYFDRARELAPASFWAWLGSAFVLRDRDPQRAIAIYRELYRASDHPLAAIALASALRSAGPVDRPRSADSPDVREALAVYARLREHPLAAGIGELGTAETLLEVNDPSGAWPALLQALKLRPFDSGGHLLLQRSVARGLPRDQLLQVLDVLQRDDDRLDQLIGGGGGALLASLYSSADEPHEAREVLARTPAGREPGGPRDPATRRLWRHLLLRTGEVRRSLESVRDGFPVAILADERNRVRGRWVRLFDLLEHGGEDLLVSPSEAADLAAALTGAGLLEEAATICSMALLRHDEDRATPVLRELRAEVRRELAFERSLRRVLYRGYGVGEEFDLDRILAELRRISVEIFGRDVVGEPARFTIPTVGELVDPFGPGLCEHLARYNRHFVLGQRYGLAAEGMMLVRLSVREYEPMAELPLDAPAMEVIGEHRQIRSLTEMLGGDLAGVALVNHAIIDMDSVRDWANEIRERREIVRTDGGALLSDPEAVARPVLEPGSVHWRLSVLSPVGDTELADAVLDMVRWHERAHLVDFRHFLPVESKLWRILGLVFGHAFSRESVEAELEARAEIAALALSPHTRLVLAHIAVFLEAEPGQSPHARGFRRLAERLARRLAAAGEEGSVRHWHRLDPAIARRLGGEMLRELW